MTRLFAALLMFAGTTAFAQVRAEQVGPAAQKGARQVRKQVQGGWEEWKRQAGLTDLQARQQFNDTANYEVEGTFTDVTARAVEIARPDLPKASLQVRQHTEILLDGRKVSAAELQQGHQVRARFQLDGGRPVATKIEARSKPRQPLVPSADE
jgi:lipopolysaccharide export LptBFGC system permease protein LptF